MNIVKTLSGVVLNQNLPPQDEDTGLASYTLSTDWVYQEFFLPPDFQRGSAADELFIPPLSGVQILIRPYPDINNDHATVDYTLEYDQFGEGWKLLSSGTSIGALSDERHWMNVFFDAPLNVTADQIQSRMRIGIRTRPPILDDSGTAIATQTPVEYDGSVIVVDGRRIEVGALIEDRPYPFIDQGIPVFVRWDLQEDQVFYAYQQPVDSWFVSIPNPLQGYGNVKAYDSSDQPLLLLGNSFSFCFRILGLVGDEGVDFLGNRYRSAVIRNETENLNTLESKKDSYWLSRPYPSKFAVESLYFDVSKDGERAVIDQVLIDPITPGVFFNIYHSNEGDPAASEAEWENKLWTHVPATYRMTSRQTHRLPTPVGAKYIKIEFSHLQAQYYAVGSFQTPVQYSKYPKWVLEYFLARLAVERLNTSSLVSTNINVVFDALDLAYSYYIDDSDKTIPPDFGTVASFLQSKTDASDQVDPVTLGKINLVMNQYRNHPGLSADVQTLLGQQVRTSAANDISYPLEHATDLSLSSQDVSVLNRESILLEQSYPAMFFYLTCRHRYRKVEAAFDNDKGYFAGVRELAFLRDNYIEEYDTTTYIETNNDVLNVEQNDFLMDN